MAYYHKTRITFLAVIYTLLTFAYGWTPNSSAKHVAFQKQESAPTSVEQETKPSYWDRRKFLLTFSPTLILPTAANAVTSVRPRTVDVGGGVDISADTTTTVLSDPANLVFPASLQGRWSCQRTVVSVDGDFYQAQSAWKALGGGATNKNSFGSVPEQYETHLVTFGPYAVVDRGYEWSTRAKQTMDAVQWNRDQPNLLKANNEVAVVQRSVIVPNLEQGIVAGGQELIRITEGPFVRAALIKQRFRQGDSPDVVEGLEIMKTFRVLDGVAGTEFPTSTTKSQIRLTRIGPLEENDAKMVSSVSSSLYFDGSNWY